MRVVAAGWIAVALVACAACEAPQADGNGEARATRAEAWPAAKPADVESVDAILSALYSAISFAPGGEPGAGGALRAVGHVALRASTAYEAGSL